MEYYTELLQALVERHPNIALDCFSPIEIEGIADVTGSTTKEVPALIESSRIAVGLPWWRCRNACWFTVRLNISL